MAAELFLSKLCKLDVYQPILNSFENEWTSIKSQNCSTNLGRFFSVLTLWSIACKMPLTSFVMATPIEHANIPSVVKLPINKQKHMAITYSTKTTTKYPMGFFQSNGNLWIRNKLRINQNIWYVASIILAWNLKELNIYHFGVGSTKASFPKSLVR